MFALLLATISSISAQTNESISGIWETQGYGWVIDVQPEQVTLYQTTTDYCYRALQTSNIEYTEESIHLLGGTLPGIAGLVFGDATDLFTLTLNGDAADFNMQSAVSITALRLDELPATCAESSATNDPEVNFEYFWQMFQENYAFFALYDVDWQALYDTYRPLVTAETTQQELFDILSEMISDLHDGHVFFASQYGITAPDQLPDWINDLDDESAMAYLELLATTYLHGEFELVANDSILYGKLSDTVGYINILSMDGFSEDGDDFAVLEAPMPTIMEDLADVDTIILDVRFNEGGYDIYSLYIAGYFTDQSTLAFSKQAWDGEQYLPAQEVYLEPSTETPFLGNVYLLTSRLTASAAEIFTMSMDTLPNVTLVGENTNGAFSDMLAVVMPNNWLATLSNERYATADGEYPESIGIIPDIEVPMSLDALETGSDQIMDSVLAIITNGR